MISSVRGQVVQQGAGYLIIEVGGLGLRLEVPSGARSPRVMVGSEHVLHTVFIVREDALTLFGFDTSEEVQVFQHMITVSGVGPRSALGVLSALSPAQIVQAVAQEDDKAFRAAPGIGPKTSKLLVVQLAGKLDSIVDLDEANAEGRDEVLPNTVMEGLVGLGWSDAEAAAAVRDAIDAGAEENPASLLRSALALLQAQQGRGGAR